MEQQKRTHLKVASINFMIDIQPAGDEVKVNIYQDWTMLNVVYLKKDFENLREQFPNDAEFYKHLLKIFMNKIIDKYYKEMD